MPVRLVLVGRRANKRTILWGNFLRATFVLAAASAALTTGAYVALARRWNPDAPLYGLLAGLGISVFLLLFNLLTPLNRLPFLPRED